MVTRNDTEIASQVNEMVVDTSNNFLSDQPSVLEVEDLPFLNSPSSFQENMTEPSFESPEFVQMIPPIVHSRYGFII